jgi:ribosomal protein S6--L-glutamate ligase
MRIGILGGAKGWHAIALAEACRRLGHDPLLVDLATVESRLEGARASLRFGEVDLLGLDRVIVRNIPGGSLEQVIFRVDLLHILQDSGAAVLNPPRAIEACVDKHLAAARFAQAGIPTARTAVCQTAAQAMAAFRELGEDVVVKPIFGAEGRGVLRIDHPSLAERVFATLARTASVLLVQEFASNEGYDVRVFLVGEDAVACMQRRPSPGEFRANVTQGGCAAPFTPPDDWTELARRAAAALGARVAGVDLLPTRDRGAIVLEVNSSPGFRAISQVTRVDVAGRIVDFAAQFQG